MHKGVCRVVLAGAWLVNCLSVAADAASSGTPAPLTLKVDVTDLERRVFAVHESIPVKPGPLTLLYPEWLPGNHAPRGPIDSLAGLRITAGGRRR